MTTTHGTTKDCPTPTKSGACPGHHTLDATADTIWARTSTGAEVTVDVVASDVRAAVVVVVGNDDAITFSPEHARRFAAALLEVAARTPESETARKIRLATGAATEAIGQAGGLVGDPSRSKVTR